MNISYRYIELYRLNLNILKTFTWTISTIDDGYKSIVCTMTIYMIN